MGLEILTNPLDDFCKQFKVLIRNYYEDSDETDALLDQFDAIIALGNESDAKRDLHKLLSKIELDGLIEKREIGKRLSFYQLVDADDIDLGSVALLEPEVTEEVE